MEDLAKFVHKKLRSGYPEGELRTDLEREGYSPEEINEAFQARVSSNKESSESMRSIQVMIGTGLLITGIAVLSVDIFRYFYPFAWILVITGGILIAAKYFLSNK